MKKLLGLFIMMVLFSCSTLSAVFADEGVADGKYSIDVTSSAAMFKVVDAKLSVLDGKMSAVITLSGTGYTRLFMGIEAEAQTANEADLINFVPDETGKYTFAIPVSALDTEINVAAYATKSESWFGRTLIFNSSTLKAIEEVKVEEPTLPAQEAQPVEQKAPVEAKTSEVKSATQEESNPKTGDSNYAAIFSTVLLLCSVILVKNRKFFLTAK